MNENSERVIKTGLSLFTICAKRLFLLTETVDTFYHIRFVSCLLMAEGKDK